MLRRSSERAGLRIAIADESPARAAVMGERLREAGLTDIAMFTERYGIFARIEAHSPEVVLIDLGNRIARAWGTVCHIARDGAYGGNVR